MRQILAALSILVLLAFSAQAQETRGSITGRVLDPSGAAIAQANVTATHVATNATVATETDSEGNFDLLFLVPGVYTVTAAAPGFKTLRREDIELRIHDRMRLDLSLELGAVTEEIRVTAETPLLEAASANLGQVIDSRRFSELPIAHGSPYSLIYLTPGVVNVYPGGLSQQEPTNLNATSTLVNINGAPSGSTDFTVDGVPNTQSSNADRGVGMAMSPPADIVGEFKIETAYDASVGHTSGAVINVSLKSGTNQFHGTAYLFHRNPNWNANSFFANRAGQSKGAFTYNRWGGSFLGPVMIPKLYNGKDRTFFTYGYEGLHNDNLQAITTSVPDTQQRTGDFSSPLGLGPQYQIYDPATISAAGGGRFAVQPFPGNIIPASRISPIANSILTHYPDPNVAGLADGTNNYSSQTRPEPVKYFNHIARFDHIISDKHRIFGRGSFSRKIDGPYRNYWEDVATANNYLGKTRQVMLDDVYMFSPRTVMNLRYGYTRFAGGHFPRRLGFDAADLGFSANVVSELNPIAQMFPRVDVSGLNAIGFESSDVLNNDVHTLIASFTHQSGAHIVKFGADLRSYRDNVFSYGNAGGRFTFATDFTRGPFDNSSSSPGGVGQGLAALLLGQPTGGTIDRNDSQAIQSTYWAFYVHDNWRVTPKLSLDLGVRWDYEGPVTERFNRAVRGFDPNATQAIASAAEANYSANPDAALPASQFQVRGGLLFAGVGGQPRLFWDRSLHNFSPRVGFAYQITPTHVLRGGFGIFPIQIGQPAQNRAIQTGFNQATDIVPTLDNGQSFIATLADPFPNGVLAAPGASLGAATFLGRGILFYNPIARTPYTMRYSLNQQMQLPGQLMLEIGYVGSKSVKLQADHDLNAIPNVYLSTSSTRDQGTIDFLTGNIVNPLAGLLPGTGLNSGTVARSQLLRPFPQFTSVVVRDYQGYAWYNALQVRAERRFRGGFTTLVGYTWSKSMGATEYLNAGDATPYRVIQSNDRPHHLTFSGIFELPFGHGRRFGQSLGRVADAAVGGWQVGAVWMATSGEALNFGNVLFTGDIKSIPLSSSDRTVDHWFNTDAGFNRVAAQQLDSNLRTFPLRFNGIRAGSINTWDISLLKNTKIFEGHQLQFRAEFLNALNHATGFAPPNTSPTSSAFGRVTGTYILPRVIQFGIKYQF